jgi:hypothetical protein
MAWTASLLQLRTDVRNRGGYRRSASLTDAILNGFINAGIAEVHELIVKHNPDFLLKRTNPDLTTTPGSEDVPLPGDFFKLRGRPLQIQGSSKLKLMEFDIDEEPEIGDLQIMGWDAAPYRYMLQAGNLRLVPTPTTADTIRLWYLPHATKLVADGDVYDGVNGHEDLVIEHALLRAAERDRRPAQDHAANIQRLERRLLSALEARDQSTPEYLVDHGRGWPLLG